MSAPSTDNCRNGQDNERETRASTLITASWKRKRIHGGPIVQRVDECNGDLSPTTQSSFSTLQEQSPRVPPIRRKPARQGRTQAPSPPGIEGVQVRMRQIQT